MVPNPDDQEVGVMTTVSALVSGLDAELRRLGFGVFLHAMVPANDGGISLGQAVIANELLRRGASGCV